MRVKSIAAYNSCAGGKNIRFDNAVICRTAAGIIERMPLGVDQRKSVGNTNSDNFCAASRNCDDDKPETVLKRLGVYHEQTQPLIDYYTEAGVLREVDGTIDINDVFAAIVQILGE